MGQSKRSEKEFQEFLQDKHLISLEPYQGANISIQFRCEKCTNIFQTAPSNLYKGQDCNQCRINKELEQNRKLFVRNLADQYPHIILVGPYLGARRQTEFKCVNCDKSFTTTPSTRLNRDCPYCSQRRRAKELAHTDKHIDSVLYQKNIERLSAYHNQSEKGKFRCLTCDHEWETYFGNVLNVSGCPRCAAKKSRYDTYKDVPTTLYYIYLNDREVYKIGITQTSVKERYPREPYELIMTKKFDDGLLAYDLEQDIIHKFKDFRASYETISDFGGRSECFKEDIKELIKDYFKKI